MLEAIVLVTFPWAGSKSKGQKILKKFSQLAIFWSNKFCIHPLDHLLGSCWQTSILMNPDQTINLRMTELLASKQQ